MTLLSIIDTCIRADDNLTEAIRVVQAIDRYKDTSVIHITSIYNAAKAHNDEELSQRDNAS